MHATHATTHMRLARPCPPPAPATQLSRLTALRRLRLSQHTPVYDSGSAHWADGVLPALQRLSRLELDVVFPLPACLPQLTRLQVLACTDTESHLWDYLYETHSSLNILELALPRLAGSLTRLLLSATPDQYSLPSAVTALTRLRSLYWDGGWEELPMAAAVAALPGGCWLSGLEQLTVEANCFVGSMPALAAAGARLMWLGILSLGRRYAPHIDAMLPHVLVSKGRCCCF